MKASMKFVEAFEKAADLIELNEDNYNFKQPDRCNVGYLAQVLLDEEEEFTYEIAGYYTTVANEFLTESSCAVSGKTVPQLIQLLVDSGLRREDFSYIEFLGKTLTNVADMVEYNSTAREAITFFREEALKMRNQLTLKELASKPHKEVVSVSVSI